jgi:tetratricopeptide (TPR) repeat protein
VFVALFGGPPHLPAQEAAKADGARATGVKLVIPSQDRALWADVRDGRFTTWSFAEAALLASGVTEPAKRQTYVDRLAALEKQATQELADAKTAFAKGEKLLVWLHRKGAGPLRDYSAAQTDLSVLLDTGKYNCVSATVLYNVLGRRLGLDLRAIEVSDHAFAVLYDGEARADVETTTRRGFNPARDKKALDEFTAQTGFVYIPERNKKQRREVGEAALVGAIYFNHGVNAFRKKRYEEALVASVCAMNLDPDAFAVKGAQAALAKWSGGLAREGRLDEALDLLAQAGEFITNPEAVLKITRMVYDIVAEDFKKQKEWQAALDLYTKALVRHPRDRHLSHNAAATWDAWAQTHMKAKEWAEAVKVYRKGLEQFPTNGVFKNNIKYCEQQMKKEAPPKPTGGPPSR